jgi:hypothetical protein
VVSSYGWLPELLPRLKGDITDYQQQVNFTISMLLSRHGVRFWPDFGRFYGSRVRSLVNKLKYDEEVINQMASLFEVKPEQIRQVLIDNLQKIANDGLGGGFFWQSIDPEALLTQEEIKEQEKARTKQTQ